MSRRILIDARLYGLENAGLGRYTMNLVDELAKLDQQNEYSVLLRKKYFNELKLPRNWQKVEADFRHYSLAEQLKLPKMIKGLKPDLVHFPHFNVPLNYQGRFVVTIHDLLMHWQKGKTATTLPIYKYFLKRAGYKTVFKKAISAEAIITPSQTVKEEILDYYKINPARVAVIYEGIDKSQFAKTDKEKLFEKYKIQLPYFIYTGNAYPHKNLERAIEAFVKLNKNGLRAYFYIASARNVFTKRTEKAILEKKAGDFVKILGFVPDDEISWLYKYAAGFLYPSLSEGFGLPGLEAVAAGTITLASRIPVFKEIYQESVIYFDPLSTESIKEALERVLVMKTEERTNLINKSGQFIKKYSWRKMAKETLQVYNVATKNGRR